MFSLGQANKVFDGFVMTSLRSSRKTIQISAIKIQQVCFFFTGAMEPLLVWFSAPIFTKLDPSKQLIIENLLTLARSLVDNPLPHPVWS